MKPAHPARPARGPALLWVVAAHLGLAWWLSLALQPARPHLRQPAERAPLWLRWVAEPAPPAAEPLPRRPPAPPIARPDPGPASPPPNAVLPQAITLPAPATPAEGPAPPASAPVPPLDLRLPPSATSTTRSWASRLRDDPRLRDAPLTLEQRIGRALDPTITEEALPDGSRRFRRGNECVIARPSRAGQIDPFDSTRPRPWLVGEC